MKCAFCSNEIEQGTGIMYVRKSGLQHYYCSNRCYKMDVIYHRKFGKSNAKELPEAAAKPDRTADKNPAEKPEKSAKEKTEKQQNQEPAKK